MERRLPSPSLTMRFSLKHQIFSSPFLIKKINSSLKLKSCHHSYRANFYKKFAYLGNSISRNEAGSTFVTPKRRTPDQLVTTSVNLIQTISST